MSSGLVYIVYGKDYAKLSAAAIRYSRRHTNLPIHVVTNVPTNPWEGLKGVSVKFFPRGQAENRRAKLQMNKLTPFDKTLYMDCDSVVRNPGIERAFELLDDADMVLNALMLFDTKVPEVYKKCMLKVGGTLPMMCYNGGIIGWKTCDSVDKLFSEWLCMFDQFGHGREMPPLNCALQKGLVKICPLPSGFFAPDGNIKTAIVQHNFGMAKFCREFNLPMWTEYKPYDNYKNRNDFRWANL